jgi:tetratricopeptide (TPR) repeat protein
MSGFTTTLTKQCALSILVGLLCACSPVASQNQSANEALVQGQSATALANYLDLQTQQPDNPVLRYNAGVANAAANAPATAQAEYQAALQAHPDMTLSSDVWYNLGNNFFAQGQYANAIEAYTQTLRQQPDNNAAKNNLELAWHQLFTPTPPPTATAPEQTTVTPTPENSPTPESTPGAETPTPTPESDQPTPTSEQPDGATPTPSGTPTLAATATPESTATAQTTAEGSQTAPPDPNSSPAPSTTPAGTPPPLSEDQARQLLDALANDSRSIQERLQDQHNQQSGDSEYDW